MALHPASLSASFMTLLSLLAQTAGDDNTALTKLW